MTSPDRLLPDAPAVAPPAAPLSRDALVALTGYRRPGRIRRALDALGVRYVVRADGWPGVYQAAIEAVQAGAAREPAPGPGPRLEAWR